MDTKARDLEEPEALQLDVLVASCEAGARANGWEGPWALQPGDLDYIVQVRQGKRLTAAEGEYLGIPRWAGMHVDWREEESED